MDLEETLAHVRDESDRLRVDYAIASSSMDDEFDATDCHPELDYSYTTKLGYAPSSAHSNCSGFSMESNSEDGAKQCKCTRGWRQSWILFSNLLICLILFVV